MNWRIESGGERITREEAKIILDGFKSNPLFNEQHKQALDMAISALSEEPNKGEWIAYDHGMGLVYLKCPFCGVFIDKRYVEHNFCGKCGAKLSGEKSGFER